MALPNLYNLAVNNNWPGPLSIVRGTLPAEKLPEETVFKPKEGTAYHFDESGLKDITPHEIVEPYSPIPVGDTGPLIEIAPGEVIPRGRVC